MQIKSQTTKQAAEKFEGCVPFEEFKRALGPEVNNYTDEQVEQIRITFDKFADIVFIDWIRKRNSGIVLDKEETTL